VLRYFSGGEETGLAVDTLICHQEASEQL